MTNPNIVDSSPAVNSQATTTAEKKLFDKNYQFFAQNFPTIFTSWINFANITGNSSSYPIQRQAGATNFLIGDQSYYQHSYEATIAEQLQQPEQYSDLIRAPSWQTMRPNPDTSMDDFAQQLGDIIQINRNDLSKYDTRKKSTRRKSNILVVLGLGLGKFLLKLQSLYSPQLIILFENNPDIILTSMKVVDWEQVCKTLQQKQCSLSIMQNNLHDPQINYSLIRNEIINQGTYNLLNVRVFRHQDSAHTQSITKLLHAGLRGIMNFAGYMEDEFRMLRNTNENIRQTRHNFVKCLKPHAKRCPALVIASGPSVELQYPLIKSLADRVVLISCGTGISGLLKNGIRPDIHCEIENGHLVAVHLKELQRKYNLDGIEIFGPTSLDPETDGAVPQLNYFIRPGPAASNLFDSSQVAFVSGTEPSVINTGSALAVQMGFETIYFFGADLGSAISNQHHSESIDFYHDLNADKEILDFLAKSQSQREFNLAHNANFGGRANTNYLLLTFHNYLSLYIIGTPHAQFYNCSDGLEIKGCIPNLPEAISIDSTPEDKQKDLANIAPRVTGTEITAGWSKKITSFLKELKLFQQRIDQMIDVTWPSNKQAGNYQEIKNFTFDFKQQLDLPLIGSENNNVHCLNFALPPGLDAKSTKSIMDNSWLWKDIHHAKMIRTIVHGSIENHLLQLNFVNEIGLLKRWQKYSAQIKRLLRQTIQQSIASFEDELA